MVVPQLQQSDLGESFWSTSTPAYAGATPVDPKQNGRPSTAKQGLHWFAHGANDCEFEAENDVQQRRPNDTSNGSSNWFADDAESSSLDQGKDSAQIKDREERLRLLKEKQNEERQRKLDELKQQALAAQKFREQKEEERRRRLEELRIRDTDKRHQVEERKRQIWEAERDRREAILRKNQEREARIESKRKNERSSIVFAFGSSTPRMLEPGDSGSSYWATRRATSTTNVMSLSLAPGPLTRRSSERELDGSKKRATSASGVERKTSQDPQGQRMCSSIYEALQWGSAPVHSPPPYPPPQSPEHHDENDGTSMGIVSGRVGRRKTDLRPTVPSPRESTPGSVQRGKSKASPGLRSGEVTPSRPQSSMSQHSVSSNLSTASASLRPRTTPRRPRPFSIAVTGVSDRMSLSAEFRSSKSSNVTNSNTNEKPPIPKPHLTKKPSITAKPETPKKPNEKPKSAKSSAGTTPKTTPVQSPVVEYEQQDKIVSVEEIQEEGSSTVITESVTITSTNSEEEIVVEEMVVSTREDSIVEESQEAEEAEEETTPVTSPSHPPKPPSQPIQLENGIELAEAEMTSSVIAKTRITTEEEAKAALAERRRQAREQAEREAELERQRLEAERLAEEERLRKEEEEQKRMEEEQLRLLEEARKSEEIRLQQAILDTQKREEEDRKKREEELKLKIEKEEAEKKAKEEAEKLRQEMEIRLKKEEEDRQARRKRVEAIMLRTRGKGNTPTTTPTKDGDETEDSPLDETKVENSVKSQNDQFLNSERSHSDANTTSLENIKQNGHHNGSVDTVTQNNMTNTLLDLNPVNDSVAQLLDLPTEMGNGKIAEPQIQPPFIAFQEKKEPHTVNDLLS